MLIVKQGGSVAVNINSIACIELSRAREGDLMMRSSVDGRILRLGTFKDRDTAQQVLNDFIVAYERGETVFRIPKGDSDEAGEE